MITEMSDAELYDYYWTLRTALDNSGKLACSVTSRRGLRTAAKGVGRNLKHLDICCAVARRRGINLLGARP